MIFKLVQHSLSSRSAVLQSFLPIKYYSAMIGPRIQFSDDFFFRQVCYQIKIVLISGIEGRLMLPVFIFFKNESEHNRIE